MPDYALREAVTGIASSSDYNGNNQDLEDTLLEVLGAGVLSGGNVTDGGGLSVNIDASVYLIGIQLAKAAVTAQAVSASATNRIWAVVDPDDAERVVYEVRTDATEPARAAKVMHVVTDGSGVTSIDTPADRNDITSLAAVINELVAARGSLGSVDARLDVALNEDGTLKPTSVATILDVKASCRVASTANVASLSGLLTIDGVTLVAGDRVLLKDQSTGSQNGIYVVAAGAWSRATDADASAEVTSGLTVWVTEGTVNGDTGWLLTTDDPLVLDTTALTFVQFSGAGQITAGDGLSKTANTLAVNVDGSTVELSGDAVRVKDAGITAAKLAAAVAGDGLSGGAGSALAVNVDNTTLEINADTVRVKDGGITGAKLAAAIQDALPIVTISVGAEVGDVIAASVQFKDSEGNNLAQRMTALCWLADAADTAPTADPPSGGWAAGTGYKVHDLTANVLGQFASDATGLMRIDVTEVGVDTWYLHVAVGNRVYVSGAITFA